MVGPIVHVAALRTEIVGTGIHRVADAHRVFNGNLAFVLIAVDVTCSKFGFCCIGSKGDLGTVGRSLVVLSVGTHIVLGTSCQSAQVVGIITTTISSNTLDFCLLSGVGFRAQANTAFSDIALADGSDIAVHFGSSTCHVKNT